MSEFLFRAKRPENYCCAVEESVATKDLAGSPTKIRVRTQHHGTLKMYCSRFHYWGDLTKLRPPIALAQDGGPLSKRFAIFAASSSLQFTRLQVGLRSLF
jgi:hypothetical protein